jgi:hypothetical protein
MPTLEFRPRFKFTTTLTPEEIINSVADQLKNNNPEGYVARMISYHITMRIAIAKRHFWSPQMDINLERTERDTIVRCLIGPVPTVWTLFVFIYSILGLGGFVALMIGFSQWSLNHYAWGFWFAPFSLVGCGLMFWFAQWGKSMAKAQMRGLKLFFDQSLKCDCFVLSKEQL